MQQASIQITPAEFQTRTEKLLAHLRENDLSGAILFDNYYILYYTGFAFIPTERPIAYLLNANGDSLLFVPRLELEHAGSLAGVDKVEYYSEYPSSPHPMEVLVKVMENLGLRANFGADRDGYPWILGYRGPTLSQQRGVQPFLLSGFIEDQMALKSPAELALIRESVKWGNLAHTLLQRYTRVGANETQVSLRASAEATLTMLDAIGPIYRAQSVFSPGVEAGYRGQIGRNAAIPHSLANNITFQVGDVLVSGANAPVWGYNSELERTMVIGPPSDFQKQMFDHMLNLQDTAFNALIPGKKCADVDRVVRAYYEEHDLMRCWKHHVGHAIGLRYHEGPFLDLGDTTVLQPGMVFTIEPGLYVPELGGFRHSDTVVITEDGIERLTYYPRSTKPHPSPLECSMDRQTGHFTSRFENALVYATRLHNSQSRKSSHTPYVAHLLAVTARVIEWGGDEDMAIAALLHDAVEDQGGLETLEQIRSRFGDRVAQIVESCSDSYEMPKPPWQDRKEAYLRRLKGEDYDVRLVSLADKLHNARSIWYDLRRSGVSILDRFKGGREGTLWYYRELVKVFREREMGQMVEEFAQVVEEIERFMRKK